MLMKKIQASKHKPVKMLARRLFVSGGLFLAGLTAANNLSAAEDPYLFWDGEGSCDALFETPVSRLPGGSYLTHQPDNNLASGHYALSGGGTLRLRIPEPYKISINGHNYEAAHKSLLTRQPFQTAYEKAYDDHIVLADVRITVGTGSVSVKPHGEADFRIRPSSLNFRLKANVRLAEWYQYGSASEADKRAWDRRSCQSYHHEMGHILVAAQVIEEFHQSWLDLRAPTKAAFAEKRDALTEQMGDAIMARQDAYHAEIETMGRALSYSRPYMELPFSWLVDGPYNHVGDKTNP